MTKKTWLSIKPRPSVFRFKRAKNLITYFDNSYSLTTITIADNHNDLLALNQETLSNNQTTMNSPCFRLDDYVAAFWSDDNEKHEWFLANVVETCKSDTVLLSCLKKIGQINEGES